MTSPSPERIQPAGSGPQDQRLGRARLVVLALLGVLTAGAVGGAGYALGAQRAGATPTQQPVQASQPRQDQVHSSQQEPQQADPARRAEADPARRAEVDARGAQVMPFDLDRTRHVFTDRLDGGVQTVTALEPGDTRNVGLIQEHLRKEADRFARGDFADPTTIHGQDMPGLAELTAGAARIRVRYERLPGGARLRYTTSDPALVDAIHAWFRAQGMDHGAEHQAS